MLSKILFFIFIFAAAVFMFTTSVLIRNKFNHHKNIVKGDFPAEEKTEDTTRKTKEQVELELLIISNNRVLKALGILDKNIKLKMLLTFMSFGIISLFNPGMDSAGKIMAFFGPLVVIILIPGMFTGRIIKKRIKAIMQDLPGFIDLTAVCVQSGMSIDQSLKRVAQDFKTLNPDLTHVFLRTMRKAELTSLPQALDELAIALPTKEIRMFVTVMQQSINFGSSIYGQLIQLSADIREMQLLLIEEYLGTLAAKMSIPLIVFIMFPIVILILAPGAMRVMPQAMG